MPNSLLAHPSENHHKFMNLLKSRSPLVPSIVLLEVLAGASSFAQHLKETGIAYTLVTHSKVGHNLGKLTELSGTDMIRQLSWQMRGLK